VARVNNRMFRPASFSANFAAYESGICRQFSMGRTERCANRVILGVSIAAPALSLS